MSDSSGGGSLPQPSGNPAAIAQLKSQVPSAQSRLYQGLVPFWRSRSFNQGQSAASDAGGTSRIMHVAPFAMHDICLEVGNFATSQGEVANINPVTACWTIETAAGAIWPVTLPMLPAFVTSKGFAYYTLPWNTLLLSCPIALDIPAAANIWVRCCVRLALPPTQGTPTTATTGGTILAASHTVAVTAVCGAQGESGVSSKTISTTGSTSTISTAWTAPNALTVPVTGYNIYLDGLLYASVGPATLSLTLIAPASGAQAPPSSGQTYPLGPYFGPNSADVGTGANYTGIGGNGSDQTAVSGTSTIITNINQYAYSALGIWGTPNQGFDVPQVAIRGDSIADGVDGGSINLEQPDRGFIARALIAAGKTYTQNGRNGEAMIGAAGNSPIRELRISSATDVVDQYGTNDYMNYNFNLAQLQANAIPDFVSCSSRCIRLWVPTLLPRTSSSDSYATSANQIMSPVLITAATNASPIQVTTLIAHGFTTGQQVRQLGCTGNTAANGTFYVNVIDNANYTLYSNSGLTTPVAGNGAYNANTGNAERTNIEVNRIAWNDWLRAGAPMTISGTAYTPVTAGTPNAVTCAVYGANGALLQRPNGIGHPISGGVFDAASTVEVNQAGTLTQDGHFWISNGTAGYYTGDGIHPGANATTLNMPSVPVAQMLAA